MGNNILAAKIVKFFSFALVAMLLGGMLYAQTHDHSHEGHDHHDHNHDHNHSTTTPQQPAAATQTHDHDHDHDHAHDTHKEEKLDVGGLIMHHVTDANEFHVLGKFAIPLPCIVYNKTTGFDFFLSNVFDHGHAAYNGYVLDHGVLKFVDDVNFPRTIKAAVEVHDGEVHYGGQTYKASRSAFYDFSITKVVFTMLLAFALMLFIFIRVARAYQTNVVPRGLQSFIEPIILFIRDEVAKPNLGHHYEKYMPYLLTVFFFIWISNMIGLVPFFPGSGNVMGNIAVTATLAIFTFIITNVSANKHYWGHIFNPPGVPFPVNLILILIEFLSVFIKPFALTIRLFANITAGHIIILSLVSIIFIFAEFAGSAGGFGVSVVSSLFILFMNALELLVAALQAYIFTMLSAVFIGQAIEEPHHH
ncbi:MAG TPA: F0F1 ATP synthase subunit A [Chitinophagales bacterium]|nr:F0F1 ATP synthase subunit A [Chitinophagales bacterium]